MGHIYMSSLRKCIIHYESIIVVKISQNITSLMQNTKHLINYVLIKIHDTLYHNIKHKHHTT